MSVLLIVEGKDDYLTTKALLYKFGIDSCHSSQDRKPDYLVLVTEGKDARDSEARLHRIAVGVQASGFDRIGIVLDADENVEDRWRSITDLLSRTVVRQRQFLPNRPHRLPDGSVTTTDTGHVLGLWLWPDNARNGILEDFVADLIPPWDVLWPIATRVVAELPDKRFSELATPKARIHTWLAWQEKPGKPAGTAIVAEFLQHNCPAAQSYFNWLQRLRDTPIP